MKETERTLGMCKSRWEDGINIYINIHILYTLYIYNIYYTYNEIARERVKRNQLVQHMFEAVSILYGNGFPRTVFFMQ
jgi:hypothetical protein